MGEATRWQLGPVRLGWAVLLVCLSLAGCSRGNGSGGRTAGSGRIRLDGRSGLVFVWRTGSGFATGYSIEDVPQWARGRVRLMGPDLKVPAGKALVANLCRAGGDGSYPYEIVDLGDFESSRPVGCGGTGPPKVVLYMSSTCPVCARAMAYLQSRGIPFVAKDVDKDPAAARELAEKAARAGLRVNGVPVFDIGGRLMQGFDPRALEAALRGR